MILDSTTGKPRPRPWIPVSLKMFVAILVLAGGGSALWLAVPAYRQHIAVREIERLGGKFRQVPWGPAWLRQRIGEERMKIFDDVDRVEFSSTSRINDADLACLKGLRNLQHLYLGGTHVTDVGISLLKTLTRLEQVNLMGTPVTDAGIADLKRALPKAVVLK